jgi:DNA-binding transcriptional ArsR family regulator
MEDPLAAIAHAGRREMLRLVLEEELPAGVIAARIGMRQPAASQHLKVLRHAGLVDVRVDGNQRLYRVNMAGLKRLRGELEEFWGSALGALKDTAESRRRR